MVIAALGLGGCGSRDGVWVLETIDGRRVAPDDYALALEDDRITGGRDGCNAWGYAAPEGDLMIVDAQECPPSAEQRAYRRALPADRRVPPASGDRITIAGGGHVLTVRRAS